MINNIKITFYSNFLNHHQTPFCEAIYKLLGDNFKFVATEKIPQERLNFGYKDLSCTAKYAINSYANNTQYQQAIQLGIDSDIVLTGSAPDIFIEERFKQNKLTFRYSERIFKQGRWRLFDPRVMLSLFNNHVQYKNRPLYMLCASAYTAGDFKLVGAYKNKCYKWGYFPKVLTYDIDELMKNKEDTVVNILWCARFLKWKHPEKVIEIAKRLKKNNYKFKLNMIGIGEEQKKIEQEIQKYSLGDCIELLGSMSPEKVREYMEKANIFLFTSDYQEGWGAVLNESMNSGCAIVASHAIGSVPFLVKDGYNGLIYKNNDIDDLYNQVKILIENKELQKKLGINAYHTLKNEWNAETAAQRFLMLINEIEKNGECTLFESGPCSKAEPISQGKMCGFCKRR